MSALAEVGAARQVERVEDTEHRKTGLGVEVLWEVSEMLLQAVAARFELEIRVVKGESTAASHKKTSDLKTRMDHDQA